MLSKSKSYSEIREYLDTVPVIETHEHYTGMFEPMQNVFGLFNYYWADYLSASFGMEKEAYSALYDLSLPFDERCSIFMKVYGKSNKTSYAQTLALGLKECWGIDEINPVTLRYLQERLADRNAEFYEKLMDRLGIKAKIVDKWAIDDFTKIIEGKSRNYSKYCRFSFPLPAFHNIKTKEEILRVENYLNRTITCLDDYLDAFENMLRKSIEFGIVCIKDQSAYRRKIEYKNPDRSEAEKIFNMIISQPEDSMGADQVKALDDWLFHHFMRLARKYSLPVQVHTGHLAGNRNDITKANSVHFISVLELHQNVKFDLFHGSWPYMDEYLFIGKNYPNAYLDLCWVQMIDPLYSIELMKRALVTVPHSKVMAFGGDCGNIEIAVGHLIMARNNTAYALSEMVDCGWININEGKEIAVDWFFNNPNEFFNLGFEKI